MIEENNIPHRRGMIKMKLTDDIVEIERSMIIPPRLGDYIRSSGPGEVIIAPREDGIFKDLGFDLSAKYNWQIIIDDMDVLVLICTKKEKK